MVLIVPLIFELFFDWWNLMKKKIWNRWTIKKSFCRGVINVNGYDERRIGKRVT